MHRIRLCLKSVSDSKWQKKLFKLPSDVFLLFFKLLSCRSRLYFVSSSEKWKKKKKTLYLFPLYSCAIFTQFHSAKSILVSGSQWMKRRLFTHCIRLFLSSSLRRTKYKTSLKFLPVIIFLLLWLLRAARRRLSTPEKINLFEANDITTNRSPQIGLQITKIRNYLQRENLPLGGNV